MAYSIAKDCDLDKPEPHRTGRVRRGCHRFVPVARATRPCGLAATPHKGPFCGATGAKLLSRARRMWYHCVRDLAVDVTTSKETSTRLLSPGSPTTTAIEDVPSSDTAAGACPALIHPVRGRGASRLRRARHGANLAPYFTLSQQPPRGVLRGRRIDPCDAADLPSV